MLKSSTVFTYNYFISLPPPHPVDKVHPQGQILDPPLMFINNDLATLISISKNFSNLSFKCSTSFSIKLLTKKPM